MLKIKNDIEITPCTLVIEKNEKNNNDENTDELFKKAIENTSRIYPPIEHDNDLSVKVTEILYDKYVGKNVHKSKHLDIYSKFKDESIKQEREWTRTKDDAKRISNMIERQEKYEELKHDKREGKGIDYYNDGNRYEGEYKNNKKEGKGIYYWINGNRYEGDYKNGKKEGKGIYYCNNYKYKGDR